MVDPNDVAACSHRAERFQLLIDEIERALALADQLDKHLVAAYLNQALILLQAEFDHPRD